VARDWSQKAELKAALIEALAAQLATARASHEAAIEGATHSESRAENDKDTRGLEQSYLARGQAARVAEIEAGIAQVEALALRVFAEGDAVAISAVVTIEEGAGAGDGDGVKETLFIAPYGGGTVLPGGVQVVTPQSPLGRALLGKRVDDEMELRIGQKRRELMIVELV
jgi:transcription elongation GreA/GreB family factor